MHSFQLMGARQAIAALQMGQTQRINVERILKIKGIR